MWAWTGVLKEWKSDQHDGQYADVDVHSLVFMVLFCVSDGDVWRKRSLDFLPTTYYYLYIVYAEVNCRRRTWWLEAKDAHTRFFHGDIIWQIFNENGGFVRELPQDPLNSGLGITLICAAWHINL